jgi:hypothetical protein
MDIGWGTGVGVIGIVGSSVGAAVAARVGILVDAVVAVSNTGLIVEGAGLQPLSMIKKIVIPPPNTFIKCLFISFASAACPHCRSAAGYAYLIIISKLFELPCRPKSEFYVYTIMRHSVIMDRRAYGRMTYEVPPVLRLELWPGID